MREQGARNVSRDRIGGEGAVMQLPSAGDVPSRGGQNVYSDEMLHS